MSDRRYRATLGLAMAAPFLLVGAIVGITVLVQADCTSLDDVTPGQKSFDVPPCPTVSDDFVYTLNIQTSLGQIDLLMDPVLACDTVNNIVFLGRAGFFDGTSIHKVEVTEDHAFLQMGDPTGTGRGNAGYTYTAEPPSPVTRYVRGAAAMVFADDDPSTASSQFFIVIDDYDELSYPARQPVNTLFGGTSDPISLRTLDVIASAPRVGDDPIDPIIVERATITETRRFGEEGQESRPCAEGLRAPTFDPTPAAS